MIRKHLIVMVAVFLFCTSCESESARLARQEEQAKQEAQATEDRKAQAQRDSIQKEKEEAERKQAAKEAEARAAKEAEERAAEEARQAEIRQYLSNSLYTGAMPYANCFGANNSCSGGCSQINVKTPKNSDVLVLIKNRNRVVRHAYIGAGTTFTFNVPDGSYQPFFYYGKGWHPTKQDSAMQQTCPQIKGAFVSDELISKDGEQYLRGNILSYELILQQNGNFQTRPSSKEEAF